MFLLLACSENEIVKKADPVEEAVPDIEVAPARLDLGTVAPFCVVDSVVTVSNVGAAPLHLTGLTFEGDDEIAVKSATRTLEPGDSLPWDVRFLPEATGDYVGDIVVLSDDPVDPEVRVPTVASAGPERTVEDAFVQPAAEVDVLWVIDNSSSMQQEQARVVAGIAAFFDSFDALGVDYHMGVITTDVAQATYSGQLVGDPRWIETDTADAQAKLGANLSVGDTSQGDESGLQAMELALSEPLLSGYNAGFYRSAAMLAVAFLSDEPEYSAPDAQHYIDFLSSLKADPSHVSVSAIVGDETSGCTATCDGNAQDAQAGDKYVAVTEAFGGVFGSICTCDITPFLADIGDDATALVRRFVLSQTPADASRMVVTVNGAATTAFTYDEEANAVELDSAPAEGADVVVQYPVTTTCEPA